MSSQTKRSSKASASTQQREDTSSSQQSRSRLKYRQRTKKTKPLHIVTINTRVLRSQHSRMGSRTTTNTVPKRLTHRNVLNYDATTTSTPKNSSEPLNEAVAQQTISDLFDANLPKLQVDAQGADFHQEGSYHNEEHIPRVALCEDKHKHIHLIAHDADALEQKSPVDFENDIDHDDNSPIPFPNHTLHSDPGFSAVLCQIRQLLHLVGSWECMLAYQSLYNRSTFSTYHYTVMSYVVSTTSSDNLTLSHYNRVKDTQGKLIKSVLLLKSERNYIN